MRPLCSFQYHLRTILGRLLPGSIHDGFLHFKKNINSSNNLSICFALYSASSSPSSSSHWSLSPITCRSVGFLRLLTPLNHAGVSLHFSCAGLFGFQAPGGSASHLSCHSARFRACSAALSALTCILHSLYAALRSLRDLCNTALIFLDSSLIPLSNFPVLLCSLTLGNSNHLEVYV